MELTDSQVIDGPEYIDNQTIPPEFGTIISGYRIESNIRETKNSIIFIGSSISDNAKKALKFVKRKPNKRTELKNEIEIMTNLRHPRILPLEARFPYKEFVCLVTPYARFQSLQAVICDDYQDGLPESLASSAMRQMLEAIQALHASRTLHRDVKPDNFLVFDASAEGLTVVLGDFGYSCGRDECENEKRVVGTPEFAAPEVYKGRGYDFSADIWSLGVSLFVMLCGRIPFQRGSGALRRGRIGYEMLEGCSAEAVDLVRKMCAVLPGERVSIRDALGHPWIAAQGKQCACESELGALLLGDTTQFEIGL